MLTVALLTVLALALWAGLLYVAPFGPCPRCHGQGRIMRGTAKKPRPVTCPRCHNVRRRQRPGSRTIHQLARRVGRERARQRKRAATLTTTAPKE